MTEDFLPSDDDDEPDNEPIIPTFIPTASITSLPLHIPIYPPPSAQGLPRLFAEKIPTEVFNGVVVRLRSVPLLASWLTQLTLALLCVVFFLTFAIVSFNTRSLVFPMLVVALMPIICRSAMTVADIVSRIFAESYCQAVSRLAEELADAHSLASMGVRLTVRSSAGAYRQPWQLSSHALPLQL